ncbi:hypothetical protein GF1_01840 [Desulfolithobacter dissulfuricans]|uniref:Uncharacterized protein n=1 Tax=Desulfolithobacter dissulfuricans TaxID=2795293 RepID=A0A915TXJ3_9BACT|nr:hypothetical protein GF1_01840 [Desulfolithobacter dissulfuricans]
MEKLLPVVLGGGELERGGEIDKKGPGQSGIGDTRGQDHLDPDHQQFLAGDPAATGQDPVEKGGQQGGDEQDVEGGQREMAASQGVAWW